MIYIFRMFGIVGTNRSLIKLNTKAIQTRSTFKQLISPKFHTEIIIIWSKMYIHYEKFGKVYNFQVSSNQIRLQISCVHYLSKCQRARSRSQQCSDDLCVSS